MQLNEKISYILDLHPLNFQTRNHKDICMNINQEVNEKHRKKFLTKCFEKKNIIRIL